MIHQVTYVENHYRDSEECLAGIRELLDLGWGISQIRGAHHGPFLVVFRKDD